MALATAYSSFQALSASCLLFSYCGSISTNGYTKGGVYAQEPHMGRTKAKETRDATAHDKGHSDF